MMQSKIINGSAYLDASCASLQSSDAPRNRQAAA
jgi:hypothetical protein